MLFVQNDRVHYLEVEKIVEKEVVKEVKVEATVGAR